MEANQIQSDEYGPYTIENIASLPEGVRAELINGDIFMMSTPSTSHQRIVFNLSLAIGNYIHSHNGTCVPFTSPCAVYLDGKKTNKQWVEPDVFVVCDQNMIQDDGIYGPPDWIIEVASSSSIERDLVQKFGLYKEFGVKEYWIVNPMAGIVTMYEFVPISRAAQCRFEDEASPSLYPDLKIRFHELLS